MWILLLVPFVGLLWVPFYNATSPTLFGFPFFYWYQLLWVPVTALLIWIVYRGEPRDEAPPATPPTDTLGERGGVERRGVER